MGAEGEPLGRIGEEGDGGRGYLDEFKLYETRSNFYVVGRNKSRTLWRVLKIDRLELNELNMREDPTTYSESECSDLLKRIDEGNKGTGGLKFVTKCFGIVGFIKFLGPYYMLLITERRKIGVICGHKIYAINKTVMMPLPNSSVNSNMNDSRNEDRYKKLLCTVDLTKDFFFSYSYRVMCSLQSNLCEQASGNVLYETMFVWNEFLSRGIRNKLKNSIWTVALVYGFFKQAKLSVGSKDFMLTLIARRSRHNAGTRYLKRGVNEKGRVANDVETEQIVFEDVPEGFPSQISSVVQNRGSIPLFWSQETSRLNIKPDIILQKKDVNYGATRLHFGNLVKRYGNPIIILNLIKRIEKRPRESILRGEFVSAIDFINKELTLENRLRFLHLDLHMQFRNKASNVLSLLEKVTEHALKVTGFFYCRLTPSLNFDGPRESNLYQEGRASSFFAEGYENNIKGDKNLLEVVMQPVNSDFSHNYICKPLTLQKGVLRTNCIDCLDRTNVAQYTYGLAAIGHQLCALGLLDCPKMNLDSPLADDLMSFYEKMGDTLAFQYGGSAAHNKIFSERRGQWKAAIQSQEFFRTLQRYYNNAYMDVEKQDSINVFLGHFQPQPGKPTLWELRSDQQYNNGPHADYSEVEFTRNAIFKRSLSDGNIFCESKTPGCESSEKKCPNSALPEILEYAGSGIAESTPEITTCESLASYSRCTHSIARRELFPDSCPESGHIYFNELGGDDELDCSNFLDIDWLSSSGNSCDEEAIERCTLVNSPCGCLSSENVINGENMETTQSPTGSEHNMKRNEQTETRLLSNVGVSNAEVLGEFSDSFIHWVNFGQTWCH